MFTSFIDICSELNQLSKTYVYTNISINLVVSCKHRIPITSKGKLWCRSLDWILVIYIFPFIPGGSSAHTCLGNSTLLMKTHWKIVKLIGNLAFLSITCDIKRKRTLMPRGDSHQALRRIQKHEQLCKYNM